MPKYYLTTPIYYVNAAPHLGSAYTTIAADVLSRWHQQQEHDTFFLTGTAEHGKKMATSAARAGQDPQSFVDHQSELFEQAWRQLLIEPTDFIRTSQPRHKQAVTAFFEKLKASGQIYQAEYEGLYCVGHEAFLKKSELDESGRCPDHQTEPELVQETNWFFQLSTYQDFLQDQITSGQLQIQPESRRNEVLAFIDQGLEDIAISRQNVDWAIPVPWDTDQTIYVWLDELFNYCSAIGYANTDSPPSFQGELEGVEKKDFSYWWPADLHLIGKDIIKFHCVIWPALLKAIDLPLPRKIFAHGHFTVNGQKMSKSLGNVIDPLELTAEYGADAVRYFLLREVPFGNDGDVSRERFRTRYNADLANGLGNLVSRTLNMIEKYQVVIASRQLAEKQSYQSAIASINIHLQNLRFDQALEKIWQIIAWADETIEQEKPWELAAVIASEAKQSHSNSASETKEKLHQILSDLYQSLVVVNQAIAPFLPETHHQLTELLRAEPLKKPTEPLFARKD